MEIPHETILKKEFENLCFLSENVYNKNARFDSALLQENLLKNRYINVLPEEQTRVKLSVVNGQQFTDYINANHITSQIPNSTKNYISCQAPLPHTINDFFRCIWEQKSPLICMVTKLIEGEKQKAHCYWPIVVDETIQFGEIFVKLLSFEDLTNLEVRRLSLTFQGQKRTITHLLYTEWPDFGVPTSSDKIRQLITLLEKYQLTGEKDGLIGSPFIHCSAGIGRTGALIAILFSLEKLRNGISSDELNVMDTVVTMRKQRAGMVQTAAQYQFIYSVVADLVRFNAIEVPKPQTKSSKKRTRRRNSRKNPKIHCHTILEGASSPIVAI